MSAETKLELLGLIDGAVKDGWAHTRACQVLDLADVRAHRWRARLQETGSLDDGRLVGDAVHRLLEWEEQAILDVIEKWGWVDRSHRKLAHRGSYTGTVFVSPSTVLRVALKHRVQLPGEPVRPRPKMPVFPEVPWEGNRIWIWDCTQFTRCKRVAYAIIDVVTRYWIGYLISTEQTHTQAQLLFATALEDPGLLGRDGLPGDRAPEGPPTPAPTRRCRGCEEIVAGNQQWHNDLPRWSKLAIRPSVCKSRRPDPSASAPPLSFHGRRS